MSEFTTTNPIKRQAQENLKTQDVINKPTTEKYQSRTARNVRERSTPNKTGSNQRVYSIPKGKEYEVSIIHDNDKFEEHKNNPNRLPVVDCELKTDLIKYNGKEIAPVEYAKHILVGWFNGNLVEEFVMAELGNRLCYHDIACNHTDNEHFETNDHNKRFWVFRGIIKLFVNIKNTYNRKVNVSSASRLAVDDDVDEEEKKELFVAFRHQFPESLAYNIKASANNSASIEKLENLISTSFIKFMAGDLCISTKTSGLRRFTHAYNEKRCLNEFCYRALVGDKCDRSHSDGTIINTLLIKMFCKFEKVDKPKSQKATFQIPQNDLVAAEQRTKDAPKRSTKIEINNHYDALDEKSEPEAADEDAEDDNEIEEEKSIPKSKAKPISKLEPLPKAKKESSESETSDEDESLKIPIKKAATKIATKSSSSGGKKKKPDSDDD